jgi:Right handed beta helix region/Bacterial TSP3 repeat
MLKWLVLPMAVLAYVGATVSAAAPRDRDHDRLPDRWERKHNLSTTKPSAKRDPDRDRLTNRRELRLRTHPRRADTDRDRLRDGAEVRRFHTNARKRDTDGDGFRDRCELRRGTNPRKRSSRPNRRCSKAPPERIPPPPPGGSPPTGGWPDASNTGVPAGTVLRPSGGIRINTAGAVIDALDISGSVVVNAPNVTIRRSRIRSSAPWAVDNNSTGLVIEDSEIDGLGANGNAVGSSNLTLRRVNIHGTENGLDVAGNVTVVDSYIHDLTTANDAHTDGAQLNQGASDIVFRHNTIIPQPPGTRPASTSCIIMWTQDDPQNARVWIEDNRLIGGATAYALYAPRRPASQIYVNRNRFIAGVFGAADSVRPGTTVTEFTGNVYDDTGKPLRAGR